MKLPGVELKSEAEQKIEAERQLNFIKEAREIVDGITEQIGRPLFYNITSFGCEMNFELKTAFCL